MPSSDQLVCGHSGENGRELRGRRGKGAKGIGKDWSKIPIPERNQCIATMAKGGYPSYVELVICVEMTKDSRAHQEEERAKNVKSKTKKP